MYHAHEHAGFASHQLDSCNTSSLCYLWVHAEVQGVQNCDEFNHAVSCEVGSNCLLSIALHKRIHQKLEKKSGAEKKRVAIMT